MKKVLIVFLSLLAVGPTLCRGQAAGNVGYAGSGGKAQAVLRERNRRMPIKDEMPPNGTSMFVEANVLMNVKADEYVAVFGVAQDGESVAECGRKMDGAIKGFTANLKPLGVGDDDLFVDFVAQTKTYGFELKGDIAVEKLVGFELKKNVSIHFKDKAALDQLVAAAARSNIHDLIKVDYIVKNLDGNQDKLMDEAARIIKRKSARYEKLLGIKVQPPSQVYAEKYGIHYPTDLYDSYVAQESERMSDAYFRQKYTVQGVAQRENFLLQRPGCRRLRSGDQPGDHRAGRPIYAPSQGQIRCRAAESEIRRTSGRRDGARMTLEPQSEKFRREGLKSPAARGRFTRVGRRGGSFSGIEFEEGRAVREFQKPIGQVFRRLRFQRFLSAMIWTWCATFAIAAVAIGVEKFARVQIPGPEWLPFAVAGGLGAFIAALVAICGGPSRLDAAVAIDRSFQLNERLSTALTLPEDIRETSAGRALLADTLKHLEGLDIGSKFGLRMPKKAWAPLIPTACAVAMLFAPQIITATAKASGMKKSDEETLKKEVVVATTTQLTKAIEKKRKELDKNASAEVAKLLAEIEKASKDLAKSPPKEKGKALVQLNKLQNQLKERQKSFGDAQQVSRQLQQLKDMSSQGPADEFAKDLAKGDFEKAANELKKLQEKLASGKMTEKDKKALQNQLGEMKKQLEKIANMEKRQQQLKEALAKGTISKEQFQKQMDKLQQQAKEMKKLEQLAQKLGEAQKEMAKGDMKKAAEKLGVSKKDLEKLAQQMKDLETVGDAMADIQDAKNGMAENDANQLGKADDPALNMLGQNQMMGGNGQGGRGRGQGKRAETADNTAHYDSKVKQQIGKGQAILRGFGPTGKQTKGESTINIQEELESTSEQISADALSNQKIPNSVRKHIQSYFDQVRKGSSN